MRAGNDGVLHRDGAAHRNGGRAAAGGAGVGHEHAALHHGRMEQLVHARAGDGDVDRFLGGLGLDGERERRRLVAGQDDGELLGEFLFEAREQLVAGEAGVLELARAAKRRAEAAPLVPTGGDEVAGFDLHVHV